jgi:hypothetical protein
MLDPPASSIDGFHPRDASSIHLNGAILHKGDVPHTWKPWVVGSIPFK